MRAVAQTKREFDAKQAAAFEAKIQNLEGHSYNTKLVAENKKLIEEIKNLNETVSVLSDSNETYQKFFINMKKSFDDFARKELLLPH